MRTILSIDGGGIRGIVPATVLAHLEQITGRPVASLFDLVAGSSTGGILALGLATPDRAGQPRYTAAELVRLYEQQGRTVFSRTLWRRIIALENLLDEKYSSAGLERVLAESFGDVRLSQALSEVLVTSYDIERRRPYFFKRHRARETAARDWPMRLAARATSAAPSYFEPALLEGADPGQRRVLVDGGVFANNPAMCAFAEAARLWPDEDELLVVSLGTGELTRPLSYAQARRWGLARWTRPLLGVVFDGVSDTVDYQLQRLSRDIGDGVAGYTRLQVVLTEGSDDIDDTSAANVAALRHLADELVDDRAAELRRLGELLVANAGG